MYTTHKRCYDGYGYEHGPKRPCPSYNSSEWCACGDWKQWWEAECRNCATLDRCDCGTFKLKIEDADVDIEAAKEAGRRARKPRRSSRKPRGPREVWGVRGNPRKVWGSRGRSKAGRGIGLMYFLICTINHYIFDTVRKYYFLVFFQLRKC